MGIEFDDTVSRREISELIDEAVKKQDEERYARLEDLQNRESEAWRKMREEVLKEIDTEDCRLSRADTDDMLEELERRGLEAVLITFGSDEVVDYEDLSGVQFGVSFSDGMSESDMRQVVSAVGFLFMRQQG